MTRKETQSGYRDEPLSNIGINLRTKVDNTIIPPIASTSMKMRSNNNNKHTTSIFVPKEIYHNEWQGDQQILSLLPLPTPLGAFLAIHTGVCTLQYPPEFFSSSFVYIVSVNIQMVGSVEYSHSTYK
jgi:hypothetical protein